MPVIYNVTIKLAEKENFFQVTWHNVETNTRDCFSREVEITPEETETLWQKPENQLAIGEKLFRFLDGDSRHLARALNEANLQGESLQVYLWTCKETADWPFELLADKGTFLLPRDLHLVRCVSDWGKEKRIQPRDRQLKFLFMACSAMDVERELDFEKEEEAIFQAAENLAIEMEVEDSGSLEGLQHRLEIEQYDVVHLSGHAGIDNGRGPYFIMENEFGNMRQVFPGELWNEALIENPPRLLFLSGCRTGEAPDSGKSTDAVSFAHLLVESYNVPAVLGWGRGVNDRRAIHAEKTLFHELSRGKSILEAVQRVRYELQENLPSGETSVWPLLRLFSGGVALSAIVRKGQRWQPKPRQMKLVSLKNSRVQVLEEGFIGRRRQMQIALRSLKQDYYKVGVLLLGTAGLGKSCLAAKICERFSDHTGITVHGKLDSINLEAALKDAFIMSRDENGAAILSQRMEMKDKLARLCAGSFKEQRYLILLDGFDQNIEGAEKGQPGPLIPEAAELLKILLHYLPFSGKMTQLIITSRYGFSLTEQNRDLVGERLEKVILTSFQKSQQLKKLRQLKNTLSYKDGESVLALMREGKGNPRLMEILDQVVEQKASLEKSQLLEAIKDEREKFIRDHVIRELIQVGGKELENFLRGLSRYGGPVQEQDIESMAEKAGLKNWQELLDKGIRLSLIEHDQAHKRYRVTSLLREELHSERESVEPGTKRSYDVPGSNVDRVHFSLVSPASVMSNTTFEIELYAHLAQQRKEIIKRAREVFVDRKIKIKSKGPVFVSRGIILNVRLDIQGMKIEYAEDTILWDGEIGNASFLVHVPEGTEKGTYKGKALIFINGIQAARLLFMLKVGTSVSIPECLNIDVKRYKSAFTSYASKDRETVLNCIHGMMKVCPELKFNMDIMTLRSGEKFNDILLEYILKSDIFYLFWSRAARDSQWVEKELKYAYENKGVDFIDPVPLEPPELAPPPKLLSDYYHFNDWVLAFKSLSHWKDH